MLPAIVLLASICSPSSCDFYPVQGLAAQSTVQACQAKAKDKNLLADVREAREYEKKGIKMLYFERKY